MTQMELVRLSKLTEDNLYERGGEGVYDPTGDTVYGSGSTELGKIQDALVDTDSGRVKQFIIMPNGGNKAVLVPVGDSRIDDKGVYFDSLTKERLVQMPAYQEGKPMELPRASTPQKETSTPDRLRLLEERLVVSKDRFKAGSVEIGKHVENREIKQDVALQRDEVVIERHAVSNPEPVKDAKLGDNSQTLNIDLEAERAKVSKQAFVTEEISVGKRSVTENQTVTETVGREVLDVNKTGEVHTENAPTTPDRKPKP